MQVISSVRELIAKIDECNATLDAGGDDRMRALFNEFRMELDADLPKDPFSAEYAACQNTIYETISGRTYGIANERTPFDIAAYRDCPFPYYLRSTSTAGHHLLAIATLLCKLRLPVGARIVEFGPGWGNSTLELARLGMDVTAVDIEPNFCELIRGRAAREALSINVVESDFFWAETVSEPFDAAIFFECFHHCDDHMRLLRALRHAVKPDGQVYLASEPIFPTYPVPWGVRMDGESLWAMRNFGWLELGFDEVYFREAAARAGWSATRHVCRDVHWASVWQLHPSESEPRLPQGVYPPIRGRQARWDGLPVEHETKVDAALDGAERERLAREIAAIHASTSWRLTVPVRAAGKAFQWGRRVLGT
jgi:SAM-dependent methyltransferase